MAWLRCRPVTRWMRDITQHRCLSVSSARSQWTSQAIRSTFIEFFKENDHQFVPSSSVIPPKGGGTYFINAGMNQFKPIFLGTVDPHSELALHRRVTNSQKCIRIGGKHNDLDDVGKDTYHHTFFEMLGSWSFGTYFKRNACQLAWELVTQVYKLPPEKLYVTYFAGDETLGLKPDEECRDIWLTLGVSPDKVLPCSSTDNFWDMGEVGPCGPCTEIHFNHTNEKDVAHLVNTGHPEVIELWNLVFMQYDRQEDQSLVPLAAKHVDTGMGLERLVAVLQGKISNYDTDLFQPYFSHIQQMTSCLPYGADAELDIAYRIVADHCRMATVSITDGLVPGRKDLDSKLRNVIYRGVKQSQQLFKARPGLMGSMVPLVVDSLGEAFPELQANPTQVAEVINNCEEHYLQNVEIGSKMVKKAIAKYGNAQSLSSVQIREIHEGRFGRSVPVDVIDDICQDLGVEVDMEEYEQYRTELLEMNRTHHLDVEVNKYHLKLHHLDELRRDGVKPTDDSYKYQYSSFNGRYFLESPPGTVTALLYKGQFVDSVPEGEECGIILHRTPMYSESGGQVGDRGWFSAYEGCEVYISDVQRTNDYVVHVGTLRRGSLNIDDKVQIAIDQRHREKCMKNHTATHILNYALSKVFGKIQQAGSLVSPDKLTFDFTCLKLDTTREDLKEVATIVTEMIQEHIPVYRESVRLKEAKPIRGLAFLPDYAYPAEVRVVSIGADISQLKMYPTSALGFQHSVELCGGTHVDSTADIGSIVITHFEGQGTKRVTAVTGEAAQQAEHMMNVIEEQIKELKSWVKAEFNQRQWIPRVEGIKKMISGEDHVLPKLQRDEALDTLEEIEVKYINEARNRFKRQGLLDELTDIVESQKPNGFVVGICDFSLNRDLIDAMAKLELDCPMMIYSTPSSQKKVTGLCFVPKDESVGIELTAEAWVKRMASATDGDWGKGKGKKAVRNNIMYVSFAVSDMQTMTDIIEQSKGFANQHMKSVSAQTGSH